MPKKSIYRYYELIEKPLQTLIKRIDETSSNTMLNSDNSAEVYYTEYLNGYSNSTEFHSDAKQLNSLMETRQNGHGIADYSSEYVSRNQNETSNANVLSTEENEQTVIDAQFNGERRYCNEDSLLNGGQFIASLDRCDSQNHEDDIHGQEINKTPHGMTMDSFKNTNDESLQQAMDTIQEQYHNVDAGNTCLYHYTADHACDSNYKLVMEAIVQLENDDKIVQQQMNVQSTDITTTIDSQIDTPARAHLETAATNQNIGCGNDIDQMDTSALKISCNKEMSNIPLSCNEIANKTDFTKHPGKDHGEIPQIYARFIIEKVQFENKNSL